jgi:hypothetical protein
MMPEQKGRSGKKPKYQIADIGGDDLTAEDISTERVLNFLIKGEATPVEQIDSTSGSGRVRDSDSVIPPIYTQTTQDKPVSDSLPSSETPAKKSLAHLFERASGGGSIAKELPLQLPADEIKAETSSQQTAHSEAVQHDGDAGQEVSHSTSLPQVSNSSAEVSPSSAVNVSASVALEPQTEKDQEQTPVPEADISPELTRYIELWKNFYRLKSGEVDVLSVMYRLTHDAGRSECYIKMHNLAEMSNLTYRYCQKVVRSLEQLGWLTKLKDYDPTDQLGILYRVNLKPLGLPG